MGIIVTHPDINHYQGITRPSSRSKHINIECPVLITNQFLIENRIGKKLPKFLHTLEATHSGEHVTNSGQLVGFPEFLTFHHKHTELMIYTGMKDIAITKKKAGTTYI